MAAHSPSAADRKVSNDRKTESNSFVAKELSYSKKTTSSNFSRRWFRQERRRELGASERARVCKTRKRHAIHSATVTAKPHLHELPQDRQVFTSWLRFPPANGRRSPTVGELSPAGRVSRRPDSGAHCGWNVVSFLPACAWNPSDCQRCRPTCRLSLAKTPWLAVLHRPFRARHRASACLWISRPPSRRLRPQILPSARHSRWWCLPRYRGEPRP